jgi:hypothetical protein
MTIYHHGKLERETKMPMTPENQLKNDRRSKRIQAQRRSIRVEQKQQAKRVKRQAQSKLQRQAQELQAEQKFEEGRVLERLQVQLLADQMNKCLKIMKENGRETFSYRDAEILLNRWSNCCQQLGGVAKDLPYNLDANARLAIFGKWRSRDNLRKITKELLASYAKAGG